MALQGVTQKFESFIDGMIAMGQICPPIADITEWDVTVPQILRFLLLDVLDTSDGRVSTLVYSPEPFVFPNPTYQLTRFVFTFGKFGLVWTVVRLGGSRYEFSLEFDEEIFEHHPEMHSAAYRRWEAFDPSLKEEAE